MTELRALSRIRLSSGAYLEKGRIYFLTFKDGAFSEWNTALLGYWAGDIDNRGRFVFVPVKGYQPPRLVAPADITSLEPLS